MIEAKKKMTQVLSQDEIDQLLTAIADVEPEDFKPKEFKSATDNRKIKIYDFKRPDKFTKEQIRTISIMHETFCRFTTNSLSAQLRSMVHIHVASVDQLTYEEFLRSIPTPTTLAIINMTPLKGCAIMEIDPDITSSIIDRICGGFGELTKYRHELTEIEMSLMEGFVVRMLGNLREAWSGVLDLRPRLEQIDTNPQFVQIVPPNEMVVMVTLETKISDKEGIINICIPYSTVEPIIDKLSNSYWYRKNQNNTPLNTSKKSKLNNREDIPIRLTAEILRRNYPVKEILKWNTETLILPLRPLSPGYCYLKLGERRVWRCQILQDCKWFSKRITIVNYAEKPFGTEGNDMKMENVNPLAADALSNAMIKISVELGTTLKTVKEVFEMGEGTILELDKLAGEPVNVMANGLLFAYGEVVVIDENFGIRITEIIGTKDAPDQCGLQQPAPEPPEPSKPKGMEAAAETNADPLEEPIKETLKETT
jgi:flagellar motor switch protein FliM